MLGLFWAYGGPDGAYGAYGGRGHIPRANIGRGKHLKNENVMKIKCQTSQEGVAADAFVFQLCSKMTKT